MSIFKYTLASGDNFVLRAPTGTTQGQADAVFYSQVAAGSLVGYLPGQTLSSGLSQITKFQLSRLDRGTAGVDDIAVLSLIAGLPVVSAALPASVNTALSNPVNIANVVGIVSDTTGYNNGSNLNAPAIGPLSSSQVQAVQASIINFVNQSSNAVVVPNTTTSSNATNPTTAPSTYPGGLGQYGLNGSQLEQSGYLKPGISNFITPGNESITGPTTFPVNAPIQYYKVTGVPGTTFTWQSVGGWYKAPTDPTWCAFMDSYAVWVGSPQEVTTNVYSTNIEFPVTGIYTFNISTDNLGSITVDGLGTFAWADFHTVGTQTATVTAGTHLVTLSITNYGGPAGIAAQIIKPDASELWNTLSIISDSINPNGFTRGGPFTFDGEGTIPSIPSSYDIPGTYFYYAFFSTGHTFTWTNFITYNGTIGPNYVERTPGNFVQVLSAPGVWTGKDGVNSLNSLLNSPLIQNIAQTTLMQNAYTQLTATGAITPPVTQPSISQGQIYTQTGLQQVSAISLAVNSALSVPGPVQSALSNFAAVALTSTAAAITNSLVNGAVNNINSGANFSVADNNSRLVNSIVTGTTAGLVSTASKFGTTAVDNYVISKVGYNTTSRLINNVINKNINQVTNSVTRSINSTVNNLISGKTTLDEQIANLGKSSDFASIASDPGAAIDKLTTNIGGSISATADKVTNFVENAGSNLSDAITNFDPTSLLTNPALLGLAENVLGIKGKDAKNINTAIQIGTAIFTGGSLAPTVLKSLGGIFGGGSLSQLSTLGSVPGLGSVIGAFMGGGGLAGQTKQAAGFSNTVNRSTVDAAVVKILGSNKIPTPIYVLPTVRSQAAATNIAQAQSFLSNSPGGGSAVDISAGLASGQLSPAQVRDAVLAQRAAQNPPSNYDS
jgi:hypothetical protein